MAWERLKMEDSQNRWKERYNELQEKLEKTVKRNEAWGAATVDGAAGL
jgi:hypothetical protein